MKNFKVQCKGCGKDFLAGHPLALKCADCKVIAARERARIRTAAWRAKLPKKEWKATSTKCTTFGCKTKPYSLGLCEKCYRRDLRRRKSTKTNVKDIVRKENIKSGWVKSEADAILDAMMGAKP